MSGPSNPYTLRLTETRSLSFSSKCGNQWCWLVVSQRVRKFGRGEWDTRGRIWRLVCLPHKHRPLKPSPAPNPQPLTPSTTPQPRASPKTRRLNYLPVMPTKPRQTFSRPTTCLPPSHPPFTTNAINSMLSLLCHLARKPQSRSL